MIERTKAEKDFIDQYTRKSLVSLADSQIREEGPSQIFHQVYIDHGREKGWISKKEDRLTARGFAVATSFLKR